MSDVRADTVATAPATAAERVNAHRCRNCGTVAPGKYCPECGQETRIGLPTVRELMRDAAGRLVALDGRLWRTLFALVFRPGMLTAEYFRGRRKRYTRPARLFFAMSLAMFAVIGLRSHPVATGEEIAALAGSAPDQSAGRAGAGGSSRTGAIVKLDDGDEAELEAWTKRLPHELQGRVRRFRQLGVEEQEEQIRSGVLRLAPYAMVVLLPVFALLQYLAYLPGRRRHPERPRKYAEHLVYGAHLHAFAFLMIIAMVLVPRGLVEALLAVWILVYATRARGKVYGGSWWTGALRALAVGSLYVVLLGLVMLALIAAAVALR